MVFWNKDWGLRAKLAAAFFLVCVVIVAVFSVFAYRSIVASEMDGVDKQLLVAAYASRQIVGETFHDQLPDSDPEHLRHTKVLTDFVRDGGMAYAYTTIQRDGRVLYTSTSASPEEVRTGNYRNWYLAEYKEVPSGLGAAFADGKPHYEEYRGEFGLFRSVFVPFTAAGGMRYVIGVDTSLQQVEALRLQVLLTCLGVGGGLMALALLVAAALAGRIVRPINQLDAALRQLAGGDWNLCRSVAVSSRDEVGKIASSFNTFMAALRERLLEIRGESDQVQQVSGEINELVSGVAQRSGRQAEDVRGSAAAVEELAVSIAHVSEIAEDATRLMASFEGQTHATVQYIEEAVAGMQSVQQDVTQLASRLDELDARTNEINMIVGVIKDIADQTNLLALNAAIEAARAGEQGRGFAVVADEVRKLSERTASATVEIGGMIDSVQQESAQATSGMRAAVARVDASVQHAGEAQETLQGFSAQIQNVVRGMGDISSAVREQANASQHLAGGVESVSSAAEENRLAAENAKQGVNTMLGKAEALKGVVGQFTL
ncbi:chemotaxis protein [Xenophilus sp. AP218F]|nr:chemotaxis protein [Xenophilus sp. AP218F]